MMYADTFVLIVDGQCFVVDAENAHSAWDDCPKDLRRGRRDGVFTLWREDGLGQRVSPIHFRPRGVSTPGVGLPDATAALPLRSRRFELATRFATAMVCMGILAALLIIG
jgi:hypothetical protein